MQTFVHELPRGIEPIVNTLTPSDIEDIALCLPLQAVNFDDHTRLTMMRDIDDPYAYRLVRANPTNHESDMISIIRADDPKTSLVALVNAYWLFQSTVQAWTNHGHYNLTTYSEMED